METEKRLVYTSKVLKKADEVTFMGFRAEERKQHFMDLVSAILDQPAVDAVPVDEIKFLYCAIDERGIPELKIQLGDRILCFRRDNDPVDAVTVVRCKYCKHYDNSEGIQWCKINSKFYPGGFDWHSFPEDGFCSYGERRTDA